MCSLYLLDQHLFPFQTSQTNPIRVNRSPQKEHQSVMVHISKCVQMCMFLCGIVYHVYHCVYWPQTGWQQPSCLTLSLHFTVASHHTQWSFQALPSTLDGSNHSQALHPYGRQSAS